MVPGGRDPAAMEPMLRSIWNQFRPTLDGFVVDSWVGILAPAKTPRAITAKINADLNRALEQPDTRQKLSGGGLDPLGGSEEAFATYFKQEVVRWAKIVKDANISIQ